MKSRMIGVILIAVAMLFGVTTNVWALASEDIILTVTIQILSVDVEDNAVGVGNAWALGLVVPSTACQSWQAAPVAYSAAPAAWQDGVSVTNDGNGNETMGLMVVCTSAGTVWDNDVDVDDDNTENTDEFVYRAIFDTVGVHTFDADDTVGSTMAKADAATVYTDTDADGADMPPDPAAGSSELLFVEFVLPSGTAEVTPTQKTLTLTISAETVF